MCESGAEHGRRRKKHNLIDDSRDKKVLPPLGCWQMKRSSWRGILRGAREHVNGIFAGFTLRIIINIGYSSFLNVQRYLNSLRWIFVFSTGVPLSWAVSISKSVRSAPRLLSVFRWLPEGSRYPKNNPVRAWESFVKRRKKESGARLLLCHSLAFLCFTFVGVCPDPSRLPRSLRIYESSEWVKF